MPKMPIAEFAKDSQARCATSSWSSTNRFATNARNRSKWLWFVDATIEAHPMVISNFQVPEASGNFCARGGRFGTHSANESMAPVFYKKIALLTYFNAGVRAVDVRDPYHPKEIGYFIPSITAATDKRCIKVNGEDAARSRSRPTMSRPTIAATSTSSIGPIPGCTSSN